MDAQRVANNLHILIMLMLFFMNVIISLLKNEVLEFKINTQIILAIKSTCINNFFDYFLAPLFVNNNLVEKGLVHCKKNCHIKSPLPQPLMKKVIEMSTGTESAFLTIIGYRHCNNARHSLVDLWLCIPADIRPPLTRSNLDESREYLSLLPW